MILIIDNYDSFTYNLAQMMGELHPQVMVRRNDAVDVETVRELDPTHLVVSPGPGRPESAGNAPAIIQEFIGRIPILGVCLGHQCLAQVSGAEVVRSGTVMHGKTSEIYHHGEGIFADLPRPFTATRYHSLVVERETVPGELEIVAETSDGTVMGLRYRGTQTWGVQFHPESVLTREGRQLLQNFLQARENQLTR
ncbi:MAG: aminodeoxychorismate/anthranilate synthase component II [Firmicutes bacterium]|nr:aminodeoxychorismate/anthranilate synthase component II [Bacillota bacterium]